MNSLPSLLGLNLAVAVSLMVLVWLASLRLEDVSIVDIAWGATGAALALLSFAVTHGAMPRRLLITGMTVVWGLRLAIHIGIRKKGKPEDFRYASMRREHPGSFPARSLFTVFLLQAGLIWLITMPVQVAQRAGEPAALGFMDGLGLGVWLLGLIIEAVADRQLRSFRENPDNAGRVLDQGLWRYSRHPNYFGESLVWLGIYLVAASTPAGRLTIFSPVLMTFFLLKVSGVPLLERALARRREGYRAYVERTSAFIPWWPKGG